MVAAVAAPLTKCSLIVGRRAASWLGTFAFLLCSPSITPASAQEAKVRMAYSAFSISFLNIFIARDAGFFKKHGLDLELIQMAGPLPIAAMVAGDLDYLTGITTGLVAAGQGVPLKGVMVVLRKPPSILSQNQQFRNPRISRASALVLTALAVYSIWSPA